MRLRSLISGLVLLAAGGTAFGLSPETEYSRRIWRSGDGLPQNKIQAISQTADGYLWIGTSGGLVRFDGVRFVVFDRSTTPAMGDDSILSLCPARDGSLWIGTEGGVLVRMKAGAFQAFGTAQGLTNLFVRAIAEGRGGELWVGTDRGIFRLLGGKVQRLDGPNGIGKNVPILAAQAIFQDADGSPWIGGSNAGLYRLNGDQLVSQAAWQALGSVSSIIADPAGGLLLASEAGLWHLRDGNLEPVRMATPAIPRVLCRDHDGNLWIGTAGSGLVRVGHGDGAAATVFRAGTGGEDLPDNGVMAVFEDREQNIWIGTQDGLLRMTRSAVRTLSSSDGLADDNVATVYEDPGGRLWIGTVNGPLYTFEGEHPRPYVLPANAAAFRPRGIYVDREGVQWFSSVGRGLMRVAGGKARVFTMRDGLRSNNIRQVLEDRRGVVWIATGSGLSRWQPEGGEKPIRTYYLEDGLAYGGVRVLAEDRNGDLLVGTDGGLNRVHEGVFVKDPVLATLGNERIWAIRVDSSGSLWLGTRGNGLVRIRDGKITRYTTRDGLLSNSIYQILEDGAGTGRQRFWMSSPGGVFAADRRELDSVAEGRPGPIAVVPYGTDSGMRTSQMNGGMQSAGCRTRAGEFWFPSVKGAVRIDPVQFRVPLASPVLIESVVADDRPVPIAGQVVIPPGRGKLEIDYTSPDLLSPDHVTFRYRLEGFDDTWTPSPKGRAAYYTNLKPGKYTFHVIARDGARPELTTEARLPIVWQPHYYESVWFYALLAILTGLLVWAVFYFYAQQTRARYALVLAERTRLAREMHDTVIQGCVGVSTLLEAARSMPASAQAKSAELVERAAAQVRLTVNEAREAVWDLRHSGIGQTDGNMEQPADVVKTLESYARQVEASEGIPVRADFGGVPAPLGSTADRNLLLVAREAIRNAVAHGHPAEIHVSLRFDPAEVRLEVEDDGRGFNVEAARDNGHYGIIGMRERVEQSGGVFEMTSHPGRGTRVVATLPVRKRA